MASASGTGDSESPLTYKPFTVYGRIRPLGSRGASSAAATLFESPLGSYDDTSITLGGQAAVHVAAGLQGSASAAAASATAGSASVAGDEGGVAQRFMLDGVFDGKASQADVYSKVVAGPMLQHIHSGGDATIIAYECVSACLPVRAAAAVLQGPLCALCLNADLDQSRNAAAVCCRS